MCVSSCAFRVSYHCFVCAWLRNMYLPNRNARNKNNLGTQETPWWNSAGLTGRNVRSPWHRVDGPPWITPWIWWFSGRFPMWETTTGHWIAGAHQLTRMWTNKWRRLDDFGKVFLWFVYVFLGLTHKKELLMEDWPPKIEGLASGKMLYITRGPRRKRGKQTLMRNEWAMVVRGGLFKWGIPKSP